MRKKVKRFVAAVVILTQLSAANFTTIFATTNTIKVVVDGNPIVFDQPPVLDAESNRVLVPMRSIFESLGYTVTYSEVAQNIMCVKETATTTITCEIALDGNFMTVRSSGYSNSDTKKLDAENLTMFMKGFDKDNPIRIVNGRTLLPTRATAEALGCKADWDGTSKTVSISTANTKITAPTGWASDYLAFCEKYAPEYVYNAKETIKQEQNGIINYDNTKQADSAKPKDTQTKPSANSSQKVYTVYDYLRGKDFEYTYRNPPMPITLPTVGSVPAKIVLDESNTNPYSSENRLKNSKEFWTESYATADSGGCNWYANGRFWEVYGIPLPHFQESANKQFFGVETYLDTADQYDELLAIRDVKDIRSNSIVVKSAYPSNPSGGGHVAFIEYVERDYNGKPINIFYTEANADNPTQGKYRHGVDGVVKVESYDSFLKSGKPIIGYIIPNPDFYKQ